MSSTIYGNTTLNGVNIDGIVDDNRDFVYIIDGKFFARLVCARDNIQDVPKPAIAAFTEDDAFYAIFAKVLPGTYDMYWDGWDTTDLFGVELKKFIGEFLAFRDHEKDIWYEFYMTFNDDNIRHADNAFHNNGLAQISIEKLHEKNIKWVEEIMAHGVSAEEICRNMPNSKKYVEEYRRAPGIKTKNLRLLSEEQFDKKYYERIGCHSDEAYEIVEEQEIIGIIMISNCNPHYGNECTFIEWVKIYEPYRGKGKLSSVVEDIFQLYDTKEIHFECPEDLLPMYTHMGAVSTGISELTENNMLILKKEDFLDTPHI